MKTLRFLSRHVALPALFVGCAISGVSTSAGAQAPATPSASTPSASAASSQAAKPVPAMRVAKVSVKDLSARLSRETGVLVAADKTVANTLVTLETIGGSVEKILPMIIAQLPKGATYRKVLLPPFITGAAAPEGDQIAALSSAQDALVRPVSGAVTPGPDDVVLLGRFVKAADAPALMTTLNLRVVYVLTNPNLLNDPVFKASQMQSEMLRMWGNMTPDQQSAMLDQQWDGLMNMDPAQRKAMISQMMQAGMAMGQKIQNMTPSQRDTFFKELRDALPPGMIPPGGGGFPGGGN